MRTFHWQRTRAGAALVCSALAGSLGCGDDGAGDPPLTPSDADQLHEDAVPVRAAAFLGFPEQAEESALAPRWLSETGTFADLTTLEPAAGVLPYGVQSALWSDGTHKERWLALPDGTIGFSERGAWSFPEGTVFIKHFGLALDESRPDELRRLETRFWIAARDGQFYGLVYKWNEDQSDAELLLEAVDEQLTVLDGGGVERQQTYSFPSPNACKSCHSEAAGWVRGVRTEQLNGDFDYGLARGEPGTPANQLQLFENLGFFAEPVGEPAQYPRLAALTDEAALVEDRVRSYWDSNCASCHYGNPAAQSWDARYEVPLADQGLLMAVPRSGPGPDDLRLIYPGEPDRSLLYLRVNSASPGVRMPPLLRNRVDERYAELLRSWILSLPPVAP